MLDCPVSFTITLPKTFPVVRINTSASTTHNITLIQYLNQQPNAVLTAIKYSHKGCGSGKRPQQLVSANTHMFMNTKTVHTVNLMADFGVLWEKPATLTATHNCLLVHSQLNPYVFSEDPSIRIWHAPGYNAVFCFGVIPNVQLLTLTRTIHQQPTTTTHWKTG